MTDEGSRSSRRTLVIALVAQLALGVALLTWAVTSGGSDAEPDKRDRAAQTTERAAPSSSKLAPRAHTDRFDERRAYALLREQVRTYGWRPAGSKTLRRLAVRLRRLMPRGTFEAIPGHPGLRNIVGRVPGRKPAIVVAAHYDVEAEPRGFVGANDGAAGTAAVVTLARSFARLKRPRGARELRFVLFDGEEEPAGCVPFDACGIRGSRAYAKRHAREVRALVLLDYIAEARGLRITREAGSDAALWAQLRSAADDAGVGALFPADAPTVQIIDDHYPFTQRGIPAIDIIDFDYPQRDSLRDDLDAVSRRSLDAVGEAVHLLVARLRRSG